jgi:hypothetical protein
VFKDAKYRHAGEDRSGVKDAVERVKKRDAGEDD